MVVGVNKGLFLSGAQSHVICKVLSHPSTHKSWLRKPRDVSHYTEEEADVKRWVGLFERWLLSNACLAPAALGHFGKVQGQSFRSWVLVEKIRHRLMEWSLKVKRERVTREECVEVNTEQAAWQRDPQGLGFKSVLITMAAPVLGIKQVSKVFVE